MEGKEYVMADGDVVEFRFNVWFSFLIFNLHSGNEISPGNWWSARSSGLTRNPLPLTNHWI
jgi:hypothetical protein